MVDCFELGHADFDAVAWGQAGISGSASEDDPEKNRAKGAVAHRKPPAVPA
jgi:hypothetical protein